MYASLYSMFFTVTSETTKLQPKLWSRTLGAGKIICNNYRQVRRKIVMVISSFLSTQFYWGVGQVHTAHSWINYRGIQSIMGSWAIGFWQAIDSKQIYRHDSGLSRNLTKNFMHH